MDHQDMREDSESLVKATPLTDDDSSGDSSGESIHSQEEDADHHSDSDSAEGHEIAHITRQNSTIEEYFDDHDHDHDRDIDDISSLRSSLTLFHAGYINPYAPAPTWKQEINDALPLSTRVPTFRRPVPSRQPTLQKVEEGDPSEDPNLVTWDQDDPENPHNWPAHRRWTSTVLIAMYAFIAPMASTMVAPALDTLKDEFDVESTVEEFLIMSIFLLAFAIGPFLWGPMSEVFGRVRVIQIANTIFLIFNTVCGFAKTKQQMMAFRFLAGIGGSAPQAIGGGILSDCFRAGERGLATAIYSLMPFLSPAIAPIMGGYMTQYISWRWVFWTTSIFDAVVQIACIILLRETHHPTVLANKVKALKKSTGNQELHTKWQGPEHTMKKRLMKSCVRPWIMLTTQPALQAMALFRGYQYGLMYLVFATFPMVFEDAYDQDTGRASLNYLSLGIGFVIGLQISGTMQDKIYTWCKVNEIDPSTSLRHSFLQSWKLLFQKNKKQNNNKQGKGNLLLLLQRRQKSHSLPTKQDEETPHSNIPRKPVPNRINSITRRGTNKSFVDPTKGLPEYRLPLLLPFSMLIPIGLFLYGWTAEYEIHWIVPNIGTCIFSIGLIVCFNCAQGYVVDTYTTYAASATGAAAFVRTMAGFSFPLFAPRMYKVLGVGWGNSVLGFVSLTLGLVAPVALWRYGVWLRSKSRYCVG